MSDTIRAETRRRLRWHAGLEEIDEPSIQSISFVTSPEEGSAGQLNLAVSDFLRALDGLNRELNGEVPSMTALPAPDIPRDIAYAVAEVLRQLRQGTDMKGARRPTAEPRDVWLVETAWLAVLAGDIDDLAEHLREEEAMRAES